MALLSPKLVDVVAPPPRSNLAPTLLWPSVRHYGDDGGSDSLKFPSLTAIKARYGARLPERLEAFLDAAWAAQDRILVLDDYLFKPDGDQSLQERLDEVLLWFPSELVANDFRLLTKRNPDHKEIDRQFAERAAKINQDAPRRNGAARFQVSFALDAFPYVHDRFAIIDGELWHFGATTGGLHRQVNAASRGWDADALDAVRFFEDAWGGDGNGHVRHHD
jgi:hypothetical protein